MGEKDRRQGAGDGQPAVSDERRAALRAASNVADRLLRLATAVMGIAVRLPKDAAWRRVASQVVRSASAGGANFEGARVAESRDGFLHKVGVAAQKVRETAFWLALIGRSGWPSAELKAALREAQQLAAILDASAKTARSQPP